MAKPHRMAVITVAAVAQAILVWTQVSFPLILWALTLICAGCVITVIRRTARIIAELEAK